MRSEKSAGGLVIKNGGPLARTARILMIQVRNLEGKTVWTFPKGHLEEGETPLRAALREVEEETGWRARARKRPFKTVRYRFKRKGKKIRKTVVWYLMTPLKKTGSRDPEEVRKVAWRSLESAAKTVVYDSDKKLLKKLLRSG